MNAIRTVSIVVAGSLLAGAAAMASAASPQNAAPTAVVRYNDLDLSTEQGAKVLYLRILGAAERVCPDANNRDLAAMHERETCRHDAISSAVQAVSSPRLAALASTHWKHV